MYICVYYVKHDNIYFFLPEIIIMKRAVIYKYRITQASWTNNNKRRRTCYYHY